jgi:hypothetical protein
VISTCKSLDIDVILIIGGDKMSNISDLNTRTLLTIPKELKRELEEIAEKDNRSLNNLIITILKDFASTTTQN